MQLHEAWTDFFKALTAYEKDPSKFTGRPHLPKYKHKSEGRNLLVYTMQAINQPVLEQGIIKPSMLAISVKTRQTGTHQVRIVPRHGYYVVEVVYKKACVQANVDPSFCTAPKTGVRYVLIETVHIISYANVDLMPLQRE